MSISKEKFKEMLKEKGLKVTNQRLLVLEVLADHRDKHMTAEDIYELVKEDYPEIGLATIYRTVQLLREMQLVESVPLFRLPMVLPVYMVWKTQCRESFWNSPGKYTEWC